MEIKRNSWHYQLNDICSSKVEKYNSLCSYFWKTVSSVIFVIAIVSIVAGFLTIYGLLLTDWYIDVRPNIMMAEISLVFRRFIQFFIGGFAAVASFFIIKYGIIGLNRLWNLIAKTIKFIFRLIVKTVKYPFKSTTVKVAKEPSLIIEMIKAKKHRYCPTIEFKGKR